MARGPLRLPSPGTLLVGATTVVVILALMPARWLGFVGWFRGPMEFGVAPIEAPVRALVVWVRGPDDAGRGGLSERERELERQLAEVTTRSLRTEAENDMLRRQIEELSRVSLNPDVRFRSVFAPVIGPGADLGAGMLKLSKGRADGVDESGVAVVHGVHLVGRIVRADTRVAWVLPITARSGAATLRGVVMLGEGDERGPRCQLTPAGDGTLQGPIEWDADRPWADEAVEPGMEVRLDDRTWAGEAQMLVLGRVESVGASEAQPERRVVRVRPVYDLSRVPELVIRLPEASDRSGAEAGGAPR